MDTSVVVVVAVVVVVFNTTVVGLLLLWWSFMFLDAPNNRATSDNSIISLLEASWDNDEEDDDEEEDDDIPAMPSLSCLRRPETAGEAFNDFNATTDLKSSNCMVEEFKDSKEGRTRPLDDMDAMTVVPPWPMYNGPLRQG